MRSASFVLLLLACASAPTTSSPRVAYEMVEHPVSGAEMPRIELPGRPEIARAVNDRLEAETGDLRCLEAEGETWYETSTQVVHAANDVLSVRITSSFYCGGAHPVNGADSSLTFDLRTGEAVRFRSLFADYERDEAEVVAAYVRSLAAEDLENCEDVLAPEELGGHYFVYTISAEGLRMRTAFPHVIAACNTTSVVPFGALERFARPGAILERMARAGGA